MTARMTRRGFLGSAAMVSAMGLAPTFLTRTAEHSAAQAAVDGFPDDRVLVVVQLGGGNDGLNTVVPWRDDAYHRARPTLALKKSDVLPLDDDLGLHQALTGLKQIWDDGELAVVHGVGYPNPDRSHFRSMEIWHTASGSDEYLGRGWLGRYFDNACSGTAVPHAGVAVMRERPQAFEGQAGIGVAFENPLRFGWNGGPEGRADTPAAMASLNAAGATNNATLDFLRHTTSNALMSAEQVR